MKVQWFTYNLITCICLISVIHAMEESFERQYKSAIYHLQHTPPKHLLNLMQKMEPAIKKRLFCNLTGCDPSWFEPNLCEDVILKIGRDLEAEARECAQQYVHTQYVLDKNTTDRKNRCWLPHCKDGCPPLVLKQPTEVVREMHEWLPVKNIQYLMCPDHIAVIPLSQSGMLLPSILYILKQCLCDKSDQKKGYQTMYVIPQVITTKSLKFPRTVYKTIPSVYMMRLLETVCVIDAEVTGNPPCLTVYTGMKRNKSLIENMQYKHFYQREGIQQSHHFIEALEHYIVHEMTKENVRILEDNLEFYQSKGMSVQMITKLRALASRDLSYSLNKNFHELLRQKKVVYSCNGDELTKNYHHVLQKFSVDTQQVIRSWYDTKDD